MNCKYCGAPLNEGETLCPSCGKPVDTAPEAPEQVPEETAAAPETAAAAEASESAEAPETAEAPEAAEAAAPAEAPKKQNRATLIVAILAALAVIAVLVVLLVKDSKPAASAAAETTAAVTESAAESAASTESAAETRAAVSYSKEASEFDDATLSQVVATVGDSTLTNRKLPYYFWRAYYQFLSQYGSYVSYIMQPTTRLDSQTYQDGQSWEQVFMDMAVNTYSTYAAAAQSAKAAGYTISAEEQQSFDNLETNLSQAAANAGMTSGEAYLQKYFGPYCTVDSYKEFFSEYLLGASYLENQLKSKEITDDQLETYYQDNISTYEQSGLTKDDTLMVNVRHILIQPEAVTLSKDDAGYDDAVQAAKDAAKKKAEDLYAEWQAGDKTEDSFAALAKANSSDTGSASNGGLYENVAPGQMVTTFNDWCFAEGRQPGDTGIVETDYGYHIMYFVSTGTESYWHSKVFSDYQNKVYQELCQQATASYTATKDLTNAAVYPCNVSQ